MSSTTPHTPRLLTKSQNWTYSGKCPFRYNLNHSFSVWEAWLWKFRWLWTFFVLRPKSGAWTFSRYTGCPKCQKKLFLYRTKMRYTWRESIGHPPMQSQSFSPERFQGGVGFKKSEKKLFLYRTKFGRGIHLDPQIPHIRSQSFSPVFEI